MMNYWEINGNLSKSGTGVPNYDMFSITLNNVKKFFDSVFTVEFMNRILLYVDNATSGSGYTPVTTPVFGKYVSIKLGIEDGCNRLCTAYQFSHELTHFVCYVYYGFDKPFASRDEEKLCTAMSLIVTSILFPGSLETVKEWTMKSNDTVYISGISYAESINFDVNVLKTDLFNLYQKGDQNNDSN